jgi:hypothetical protein
LKSGTFTIESAGNQIKYVLESAKVLSEGRPFLFTCDGSNAYSFLKAVGAVSCVKNKIEIKDVPSGHELLLSVWLHWLSKKR